MSRSTKNPYVYAKPPFPFQTSGFNAVRLTEIQFFVLHTVKLPGNEEAVIICWHVEAGQWFILIGTSMANLWNVEIYESNAFFLTTSSEARAIVFVDEVIGVKVIFSIKC